MRSPQHKTNIQPKSRQSQAETEDFQPDTHPPTNPLLAARGSVPNPTSHAAILQRSPANPQAILQLQRQYGNRYVNQLLRQSQSSHSPIQAKLTLGAVGDKYEQEADRVAKQVVNQINAPATPSSIQSPSVQRQETPEEDDELMMKPVAGTTQHLEIPEADDELMMKSIVQRQPIKSGEHVTPEIETSIQQARGSGQPLPDTIRQPMEQAFGADFSQVKVYADERADRLNRSIQAKAFTTGQDIFFRQRAYQPENRGGQELIAHELTHVVQQGGFSVQQPLANRMIQRADFTQEGYPLYQLETKPHDNNWQAYVNKQFRIINDKLTASKKGTPDVDVKLFALFKTAIEAAKELDKGTVGKYTVEDNPDPTLLGTEVEKKRIKEPQDLAAALDQAWDLLLKTIEEMGKPIAQPPIWGSVTKEGMGTWVDATFTKVTTHPIGSGASGTETELPWEEGHLTHRGYNLASNETIYVRGHLLNDHLGGPTAPYNLVPLTGKETRSSTNANKVHEGSIENRAKLNVAYLYWLRDEGGSRSPSPSDPDRVRYRVVAIWENHKRLNTPLMAAAQTRFNQEIDEFKDPKEVSVEDIKDSMESDNPGEWQDKVKDAVDAVVPYKERGNASAMNVSTHMDNNAKLWVYEDENVPRRLFCQLDITYQNGETSSFKSIIDNFLPQEARTPYIKKELEKVPGGKQPAKRKNKAKNPKSQLYYSKKGTPYYQFKTEKHDSNWFNYLERQYTAVHQELKSYSSTIDQDFQDLDKLYEQAKPYAKTLDTLKPTTYKEVDTAVPFLTESGTPPEKKQITEPQDFAKIINEMWAILQKRSGGFVMQTEPPIWGPVNSEGMGSWVYAKFTKVTVQPIGSSASGTKTELPWDDNYLTHRGYDLSRNSTIYVRGHLLNDHLGGPSTPYNLVPLTGSETRSSANANKVHEGSVENKAKMALYELYRDRDKPPASPSREDLLEVHYRVLAIWGNHKRKSTNLMEEAAKLFEVKFNDLKSPDATVEAVRKSIPKSDYKKIWTNLLKGPVDAVVPYEDRASLKAQIALERMKFNAKLWKYEDEFVPTELMVELTRVRAGGKDAPERQIIENTLPQESDTPLVKQE